MSKNLPPVGDVVAALEAGTPRDQQPTLDAIDWWRWFVYRDQHKKNGGRIGEKKPSIDDFVRITKALVGWVRESSFQDSPLIMTNYKEVVLRRYRWRKDRKQPGNPSDNEMAAMQAEASGYLNDLETWLMSRKRERLTVAKPATSKKGEEEGHDLNEAEQAIRDVLENGSLRGPEIARKSGYKYGYVRRLLPRLVEKKIIAKVRAGYCQMAETKECESQAGNNNSTHESTRFV